MLQGCHFLRVVMEEGHPYYTESKKNAGTTSGDNVVEGALNHARVQLQKTLGIIITSTVAGSILYLSAEYTWGAWMARGIEFL